MKLIKSFYNLFNTKKININAPDSARNLTLAVGNAASENAYTLTANPSGSTRSLNLDPLINIRTETTITQPLYGANLKIEVNGEAGTSKTGGVFGINAYSLISGVGHTVDKNVGMTVRADVGNNLTGTIVNNNFSLEVNGVAARTNTVITNTRSVVVNCPNHGITRRGLLIGAEGTTGLAVGTNNISLEVLGTSRFFGDVAFVNGINIGGALVATNLAVFNGGISVAGSVLSQQFRLVSLNTAPSTSSSTGTLGEIRIDADHIYVCAATNTWKRAALTTW